MKQKNQGAMINVCAICEEPQCLGHMHLRSAPERKEIPREEYAQRIAERNRIKAEKGDVRAFERRQHKTKTSVKTRSNMRLRICRSRHVTRGEIADRLSSKWALNASNMLSPAVQVI